MQAERREAATLVYLVRHGRTAMNAAVRFRGRMDVPLDEIGRQEALEVAENLAPVRLAKVYSSPLSRARDVAAAIVEKSGLTGYEVLDGLTNLDYGDWEGLTKEECADRDPELFATYANNPERAHCPSGESLADAADRMVEALRTIGDRSPGEPVAAVTHGAMVRLAALRVGGRGGSDWQFYLPTGAATVFVVERDGIRLVETPDRRLPDPIKGAAGQVPGAPERGADDGNRTEAVAES